MARRFDFGGRVEGAPVTMTALPSFGRSAIEAHVSLLHDLAAGLDGILILAAFEEGGLANVQRFQIGDVAGMVETIMGFDGHPRANLYTPWAVMRRDLEPCKKGTEADVVAVLAAVPDLDNDKYRIGELPVEAPYIIESSPGNFQPVYIFERPLMPVVAKPVLTAISDFIGGDSGTKDCSHVWRIPGTLNIPTKSKLARGRSPIPAVVAIKKHYDGCFIDPGSLLKLAPPPRRPNGHDTAPNGPPSFAEDARLRGAREWAVLGGSQRKQMICYKLNLNLRQPVLVLAHE
jgi:RepB DNA-primase from phage plasmid